MTPRRDQPPSSTRTVVLGFDALAFEYLDAFSLPAFDALRARGVEAPLRSTHPPWTASAWPSFYTGVDPSHHGIYDFFDYGSEYPDQASMVTREDVHAPALWNYCSARGLSSMVCNVPITYPADRIRGTLIPGYLAPETAPGHPEGIREELDRAVGEYRIYSRAETSSDGAAKLAGYLDLIDLRRRSAQYLLETREWDLAVIQVQKTDAVFHNFTDRDAHRRVYEAADALLGTVLETVPEDTNVIVCSDHGIGPVPGYRIYVNEVLRDLGLAEATAEGGGASLGAAKRRLLDSDDGSGTDRDDASDEGASESLSPAAAAVGAATSILGRAGVTPADVYSTARRFGLAGALETLVPDEARAGATEVVDWPVSKAYCRGRNELGVRINLEGREPRGVVPESEYERVREAIVAALDSLETPDGEPAFEWVRRREAVYEGPHAEDACDVLFMPTGMNHVVESELVGREFVRAEGYDHKPVGTFVASGPAFRAPVIDELSLTDIAPIVMAALGQPVPERMGGTVPDGLVAGSVPAATYADVAVDTGLDDATDERITERLSDLGYL